MMPRHVIVAGALAAISAMAQAEERGVFLQDNDGARIRIATLDMAEDGTYAVRMETEPFTEHFLSMRPFKCLEGPDKHWCHVPYPYEIGRDVGDAPTDLEYDFLFLWKDATEYGIDMWNGVYYVLAPRGQGYVGVLHEMDMNVLSVPPEDGELRPIRPKHLEPGEPDSHWLPRLVIE